MTLKGPRHLKSVAMRSSGHQTGPSYPTTLLYHPSTWLSLKKYFSSTYEQSQRERERSPGGVQVRLEVRLTPSQVYQVHSPTVKRLDGPQGGKFTPDSGQAFSLLCLRTLLSSTQEDTLQLSLRSVKSLKG